MLQHLRRPASPILWRDIAPRALSKHVLVAVVLAALAAALTLLAMRSSAAASLATDVTVRSTSDPFDLGATTAASVELFNHGEHDVRPRFSISWLPYPYYWRVVSGPAVLAPGERATYEIQSPDAVAAPPNGLAFQVKVNDAASIVYAISEPMRIEQSGRAIVNPGLRLWTQRDPASGLLAPAGWRAYDRPGSGDTTLLQSASVFGVQAAHLRVIQDGAGGGDDHSWTHTGLIQEAPFPEAPFDIRLLSRAPFQANESGWPLTAFGLEIADASNGMIWFLFQQTGNGDREYDLPSGHHIVVFDVPAETWSDRTIDLEALYRRLNWAPPQRVTFKLFAAAASRVSADLDGYIERIDVPRGDTGRR